MRRSTDNMKKNPQEGVKKSASSYGIASQSSPAAIAEIPPPLVIPASFTSPIQQLTFSKSTIGIPSPIAPPQAGGTRTLSLGDGDDSMKQFNGSTSAPPPSLSTMPGPTPQYKPPSRTVSPRRQPSPLTEQSDLPSEDTPPDDEEEEEEKEEEEKEKEKEVPKELTEEAKETPKDPAAETKEAPKELTEEEKDKINRMRKAVVQEIVETERVYIQDLEILVDVYQRPLKAKTKLINAEDHAKVFGNAELILGVNSQLLVNLNTIEEGEEIGKFFLQLVEYFKMYSTYCSGYEAAATLLANLRKKKKDLDGFINDKMNNDPTCKGLDVLSYLIKPMQRICKYPLLFKELVKYTSEDHPDYANLTEVLEKTKQIAKYVNERKAAAENMQKILSIFNKIDGLDEKTLVLVTPTRRFFKEGLLVKHSPRGSPQQRYFYLFNDLLLYAKVNRDRYLYRGHVPLDAMLVRDTKNDPCMFEIVRMDKKKKTLLIKTPSIEERNAWMSAIEEAHNDCMQAFQSLQTRLASTHDEEEESDEFKNKRPEGLAPPSPLPSKAGTQAEIVLNEAQWLGCPRDPCVVAQELVGTVIDFIIMNEGDVSDKVLREKMASHPYFAEFEKSTGELQRVSLSNMKPQSLLSFWLNVYNVLFLHSAIRFSPPEHSHRDKFMKRMCYQVGVYNYSLSEIACNILHCKLKATVPSFKKSDLRRRYAPYEKQPSELINLVVGKHSFTKSSVRVVPFTEDGVIVELHHLLIKMSKNMKYEDKKKHLYCTLPAVFSHFQQQTGMSTRELLEFILSEAGKESNNGEQVSQLCGLLKQKNLERYISFTSVNWEFFDFREEGTEEGKS